MRCTCSGIQRFSLLLPLYLPERLQQMSEWTRQEYFVLLLHNLPRQGVHIYRYSLPPWAWTYLRLLWGILLPADRRCDQISWLCILRQLRKDLIWTQIPYLYILLRQIRPPRLYPWWLWEFPAGLHTYVRCCPDKLRYLPPFQGSCHSISDQQYLLQSLSCCQPLHRAYPLL